jgi:hypothetical protein
MYEYFKLLLFKIIIKGFYVYPNYQHNIWTFEKGLGAYKAFFQGDIEFQPGIYFFGVCHFWQ